MKKYKYLSCVFLAFAILLSNVMSATVAYGYCNMQWSVRYAGASAPADVAFLFAIPYGVGIAICVILAWIFHRRYRKIK